MNKDWLGAAIALVIALIIVFSTQAWINDEEAKGKVCKYDMWMKYYQCEYPKEIK